MSDNLKQLFRRYSDGQLVAKDEAYPAFYGFQYTQVDPSDEWIVKHYTSKNGIYNVFDDSSERIIPKEIIEIDNCTTQILFNYPIAGFVNIIFLVNENSNDVCTEAPLISPTPTISVTPTQGSFNQPFDYALIRYTWGPSDGRDLDTRTAVATPSRLIDVGWDRASTDGNYLTWGGDNTSTNGPEAVLVNFKDLASDYPDLTEFVIRMRIFWYGEKYDGNVGVNFQTYLGGTMEHTGTDFTNVGGTLVNDAVIYVNTPIQQSENNDGYDIGTLSYDPVTKYAFFTVLSPPVGSITPSPTATVTPTPTISVTPTPSIS